MCNPKAIHWVGSVSNFIFHVIVCVVTPCLVLCEGSTAGRESDSSFLCTFPPEEKVEILLDSHAFSFLH